MNINELIKIARDAQNKSYSPYSNFRVGCALLMKDGKVISGANIENASYSLTICAERSTLFTAHNLGYKKDDKATSTEITQRTIELKDFLRRYFTEKTIVELRPQNEQKLKIELRNAINDEILSSSKIKDVSFQQLDVLEQ